MKYRINYGAAVGAFPKSALDVLKRAGESEVKVLFCLCAHEGNIDNKKLSRLSGADAESVNAAISFWRGAGVIEPEGAGVIELEGTASDADIADVPTELEEEPVIDETPTKKKLKRSDELPSYTSEQLSEIIESRAEITTLINECQNILGKVFSLREINILIGLIDYLSLDFEYIMMLLTYCVEVGKKTLHYAEKLAFGLYDAGICTAAELAEELRRRELSAAAEGKIRSMFGIGARAFTQKEKKFISKWTGELGYGLEIIAKAYEVTADATGNASFAYANSVIERWYAEGLKTLDEIENSYKKDDAKGADPAPAPVQTLSDEFFEKAMRRALGEDE